MTGPQRITRRPGQALIVEVNGDAVARIVVESIPDTRVVHAVEALQPGVNVVREEAK